MKAVLFALSENGGAALSRARHRCPLPRLLALLAAGGVLALCPRAWADHYMQTNLVSDLPNVAATVHAPLVNPWGLTRSATSPWWVSDNGSGVSTLYNGAGTPLSLMVTVPVPVNGTPPSTPTGVAFNGSTAFPVAPAKPARFIFATEDGTISGWNSGPSAVLMVDRSGSAVYKGLALAQRNGANFLYAANFFAGTVEVFDANFQPVTLGPGAFRDWELRPGFAPFNVLAINGTIYVTFAKQDDHKHDEVDRPGLGAVDAFTPDGVLLMRFERGPWLNAPWGIAWAPATFGRFSNRILVGNFGSGKIAAFDPVHGRFCGFLRGDNHRPLTIDGLWALGFGNDGGAGPSTTLYFTAGINDEADGLFGTITSVADQGDGDRDHDDR